MKTECDRVQRERVKGERPEEIKRKRMVGKQNDGHVAKRVARVKEEKLERQ